MVITMGEAAAGAIGGGATVTAAFDQHAAGTATAPSCWDGAAIGRLCGFLRTMAICAGGGRG